MVNMDNESLFSCEEKLKPWGLEINGWKECSNQGLERNATCSLL